MAEKSQFMLGKENTFPRLDSNVLFSTDCREIQGVCCSDLSYVLDIINSLFLKRTGTELAEL